MKWNMLRQKKDRIFYSFLLSYLVIAILAMSVSLSVYFNCESIMRQETLTSQSHLLSQLQNSFDYTINTVLRTQRTLVAGENLTALAANAGYSAADLLVMDALKDELANAARSMDFCSGVAVHFAVSESILTTDRRYAPELVPLYAESLRLTRDELLALLDIDAAQGYRILEAENGEVYLFFLHNIYNYNFKTKLATLFTIVPWQNIAENITPIGDGGVYWINPENRVLEGLGSNAPDLPTLAYKDFTDESRLLVTQSDGQTYISSYRSSSFLDFKYCMTVTKTGYYRQINTVKTLIIVQIAVALAIALAMAIYFSMRNYHPIAEMLALFRKYHRIPDAPVNFGRISGSLERLLTENTTLNASWKRAKVELSSQVVAGFIHGWNTDIATLRETITSSENSTLKESDYIVLLISYRDVEDCPWFRDILPEEEAETWQLLQVVFVNVFTEKILSRFPGLLCTVDGAQLCILNLGGKDADEALLSQEISECVSWYRQTLNLKLAIGASHVHADFESLPKAYNEASQVLSYQSFWGGSADALMFFDDDSASDSPEGSRALQFLESERRLHNLLVTMNDAQAHALLDQILDECFIRDIKYMGINQCRMHSLINTIYSALGDILEKSGEDFLQKSQPVRRMMAATTIDAARQVMKEIFNEALSLAKADLKEEKPRWLADVTAQMEARHADPNLSVAEIADRLGMNLAYVGRVFRKYNGIGLTDFIHLARLKDAKQRLARGESVKDTAEAVGYIDSKTLIRVFKKIEGITPGQFRERELEESTSLPEEFERMRKNEHPQTRSNKHF